MPVIPAIPGSTAVWPCSPIPMVSLPGAAVRGADVSQTRLLLQRTLCLYGAEMAELF